jgi:hypothetical protein
MPKITDAAALRFLNGPQTAMFNDPYKDRTANREDRALAISAGSLANAQANSAREAQRQAALLPAETTRANAEAQVALANADQKRAENALASMSPNSDLHGEAFLKASGIPQAQWPLIRAYARGDLGSRAGGFTTSMLPIIQAAMNYDPSASGTNFPARVKMQSDLADGKPGAAGGQLQAMERMLLHGAEVMNRAHELGNVGSGFGSSVANSVLSGVRSFNQSPVQNAFAEAVSNYGPEAQRAISGGLGGEREREARGSHFANNMSPQAVVAGLQSDAAQAMDAMGATNNRYRRIMGHDILDMLSPKAKAAYNQIMSGGVDATGKPVQPATGFQPLPVDNSDPEAPTSGGGSPIDGGGGGAQSLATDAMRTVDDPQLASIIDKMVRNGMSADQINSVIPEGNTRVTDEQVKAVQDFLAAHPGYKGSFASASKTVPNPFISQAGASGVGAYAINAADALTAGNLDSLTSDPEAARQGMAAVQSAHPVASVLGGLTGSGLAAYGAEAGLANLAGRVGGTAASILANPITANAAYGAAYGAGSDDNNRVAGALLGAGLGAGGTIAGQKAGQVIAGLRKPGIAALTGGESMVLDAANKTGRDKIAAALSQASDLGVPMGLADASPEVAALTGSAIRKSPVAAALARDTLIPRGRGQYDRMVGAIERDLGPATNIPQQSADLMTQAQTAAAPLYGKAYGNSVPSTPEMQSLLATPFGRQALSRARTIAANERRNPAELGFAEDADGNVVLNPHPNAQIAANLDARAALDDAQARLTSSRTDPNIDTDQARTAVLNAREHYRQTQAAVNAAPDPASAASVPGYTQQTLDYVKRGMDDVLEAQRNPITGRLQLDEAGRAQNGVLRSLLGENDRLNPDFADARAAYAGPASARDALSRGSDAVSLSPNELGMQISNQTPEQLAQMQLGFQGQLAENAGRLRNSTNPFESVLGTPAMEQRLNMMYTGTEGANVERLLAQRDLEARLAGSTNGLIGNSATAGRIRADAAFDANPLVEGGLHAAAAMATHGASIPGTAARLAGVGLRDKIALGLSRGATQRADEIAPIALNLDPTAAIGSLDLLTQRQKSYDVAKALLAQDGTRPGQVLGAALPLDLLGLTYGSQQ